MKFYKNDFLFCYLSCNNKYKLSTNAAKRCFHIDIHLLFYLLDYCAPVPRWYVYSNLTRSVMLYTAIIIKITGVTILTMTRNQKIFFFVFFLQCKLQLCVVYTCVLHSTAFQLLSEVWPKLFPVLFPKFPISRERVVKAGEIEGNEHSVPCPHSGGEFLRNNYFTFPPGAFRGSEGNSATMEIARISGKGSIRN